MPCRCALGCENNGTPLHRFSNPVKFPEQFKAWVKISGGKIESPEDYIQYRNRRICDIHFTERDWTRNRRLNVLAVPSQYLPMWCTEAVANVSNHILSGDNQHIIETDPAPQSLSSETNIEQEKEHVTEFFTAATNPAALMNCIANEHSYCMVPFAEIVQIAGTSSADVPDIDAVKSNIVKDHNYFRGPGFCQKRRGILIPSFITTKLKDSMRQMKILKREVLRLKKRGLSFKARLKNAQKMTENMALQNVTKDMSSYARIWTKMQLSQSSKKPKGRRFTTEEKILSLSIFKRSPKCYSLLSKYFALPSNKALKMLLATVQITPGINKIIFEKIKITAPTMNVEDTLCSLIFDEMSITPQVHYDAAKDQLKDFSVCNKIANHALVFMVKGIRANFKQPVAYYLTNNLNKNTLKTVLIDVIKNIQATGLRVICTVCDQSTVNVSTINSLVEDTKSQYLRKEQVFKFRHIKINNNIIIPLFDVPHLLKGLRNNLLTKDLLYYDELNNKKIVKWEYFEMIYAADKSYGELRIIPKLTEEHINKEKIKKMKVKSAAQVFSHSVAVATEHLSARGDLPSECRDLIPLIILLDNLFDSLNVSSFNVPNGKIYKGCVKKNSPHHLLWQKGIHMLKTVKFIVKKNIGAKVCFTEISVPSVTNFIKTIEGVQNLWKILNGKYSFDSLLTRNLNQDPVENFFGNIRSYGARNVAPNCIAFEGAYKALLLNNYSAPHSIQANCEEDNNKCLQTLEFFFTDKSSNNIFSASNDSFSKNIDEVVINYDVFKEDIIADKGQSSYVCGWVLTKCFKNIIKDCKICKKDLCDDNNSLNKLIKAKEYTSNKRWLCYPNEKVTRVFQDIQNITCSTLKKDVPKYGLRARIKMLCNILTTHNFGCKAHNDRLRPYFEDVTIKLLIYSWCRSVNRILSGKIMHNENDEDEIKSMAQIYKSNSVLFFSSLALEVNNQSNLIYIELV